MTKLTKFGAFASLKVEGDYEVEGLIHISELSARRIEHPKEEVHEGQTVTLRVIKIDRTRKRIGLSLKRVASAEYADLDWKTAMADLDGGPAESAEVADVVEDFDAALDEEDAEAVLEEAEEPDFGDSGGTPPESD